VEAADLLAKGYKQDAFGNFTAQGTPPEVAHERALANKVGGPPIGGEVSVSVVTPQGLRETVNLPAIDHKAMGRKTDPAFERSAQSVKGRIRQLGTVPAAVVSFLPDELRSDSYLYPLKVACIKPPKAKEPYSIYVFAKYFIDYTKQHVDSPTTAFEWAPIQMAMEFQSINPRGVFVFSVPVGPANESTAELHRRVAELLEDPAWKATVSRETQHGGMTYGEALELKRLSGIAWMDEQLARGNTMDLSGKAWERPGQPQKAAARRLHALGRIQELPKWVEQQRDLTNKPKDCPQCARRCEPGAVSCTNPGCGGLKGPYVLDPRKAYEIGAISEEDESLERLDRRTLKEMGISDYVAESVEEKKARLAEGGIKPKSVAAFRVMEAEDMSKRLEAEHLGTQIARAAAEAGKSKKPEKSEKE
jgi:hypothetical protein